MIVILLFNIFSTSSFVINSNQATAEGKCIFFVYQKQSQQKLNHHQITFHG